MSVMTALGDLRESNRQVTARLEDVRILLWDEALLPEDDPVFSQLDRLIDQLRRQQDGLDRLGSRLRGAGCH